MFQANLNDTFREWAVVFGRSVIGLAHTFEHVLSKSSLFSALYPLLLAAAVHAAPALDDYSCLRGANYVPSYARNDVQIWMDYDAAVVDRELGYAAKLKLNCVRVFLQVAVYEHDPRRFLDSFESFLSLCEKHRIQMMPVIFDSCFGEFPDLKKYRDKDWMACPGQNRLGPEHWPALQKYIADIVGAHRDDKRILMWDVMNEPTCTSFYKTAEDKQLIHTFLRRALDWVKAQKPNQPRTVGLMSSDELGLVQDQVDVLCFHNYRRDLREDIRKVQELGRQQGKPTIINEVVGRPQQGFEFAMPILREEKIGWCFWELMLGKTQFSRDHNSPYQGLIYPDGTIYDAAEAAAVMDESSVKAAWLFPQRRWTREQAWAWYMQRPWIVGFNYVPSTAANTTEFWSAETFDEKTIDRELDWGAGLGFNCCRVFVQHLVWKHDPAGLKQRLDKFLSLAHKHGLSTTLVLFDDCAFGDPPQTEPYLGKQRDPIPGMILPSWTPSPGHKTLADSGAWPSLEKYVKDIVGTFGQDRRVLMWDLYNEPSRSLPLVEATFGWARAANPSQPLTMGPWGGPSEFSRRQLELSDVISFHFYGNRDDLRTQIANYKNYLRPVINTEWMARLQGSRWETDLPLFKQEAVGCYSWGLVNGRTQCQFAWHHKRGTPEPRVWFHDLFHRDGQPYDLAEHEDIRKITADKSIAWAAADYSQMQTKPGLAPHTEDGITFSDGWTRWTGSGPRKDRLHYANVAGSTATWAFTGSSAVLVHKIGPDCGIARVLIDGEPAPNEQIDTYSESVVWNQHTVLATNLPPGAHAVTILTSGKRNEKSSNSYVQIVDIQKAEQKE